MIKIKRAYAPPSKSDGKRILVDRLWPRGIKKADAKIDEWIKDAAPSTELRKWFSHDPAKWEEFRRKYKDELKEVPELVQRLRSNSKKGTITLVFAAKDTEHVDAVVLKEVIEKGK